MIAATRIPTHRNDGSKVSKRELKAILDQVRAAFRGFSLEKPCDGAWVADDGRVYEEQSQKLEVVVSHEEVNDAREFSSALGSSSGSGRSILKFVRAERSLISNDRRKQMPKSTIKKNALALLALARQLAVTPGLTWVDASNAIYAPGGPFARLFPTKADRVAYGKTEEGQQVDDLIHSLPEPPVRTSPNGREDWTEFMVPIDKSSTRRPRLGKPSRTR